MKRHGGDDSSEKNKKKSRIPPEINDHFKLLVNLYSAISCLCLFLEQKLHPRNEKGIPVYEFPLSSLERERSGFPVSALLGEISTIVEPLMDMQVCNITNEHHQSSTKLKISLKMQLSPGQKISVGLVRKSLMSSRKDFQCLLSDFVQAHGKNWTTDLSDSSTSLVLTKDMKDGLDDKINTFDPLTFVTDMKAADFYQSQIVDNGAFSIPKRNAIYGEIDDLVPDKILLALSVYWNIPKENVRLYKHQALSLSYITQGYSVIVSTNTSSGKSLIYQLPILTKLLQFDTMSQDTSSGPTAIFLFPTKALAQDQLRSFKKLSECLFKENRYIFDAYDGDTSQEQRDILRNSASVIFSNPDTIHANILPDWGKWESFLKGLKYVVIDELHTYTGLFGANVLFTLRRLKRICCDLGNTGVQIISCSATVNYPEKIISSFFALDEKLIKVVGPGCDGSPSGERHWLLWNSPITNRNIKPFTRLHPIHDSTKLFVELLLRGARTIAFCKVRRTCELLMKSVQLDLDSRGLINLKSKVMSYRGGYTISDRRKIERNMFSGELMGIVATNALELGIDIGGLDAVLIVGFPFTIANLRQQSGRGGRRENPSLTILIGGDDPVDQYYMTHPLEISKQSNPDVPLELNRDLLVAHLQCAAYELPISIEEDEEYFDMSSGQHSLEDDFFGSLVKKELTPIPCEETCYTFYGPSTKYMPRPASLISLRGLSGNCSDDSTFTVINTGGDLSNVIENIEDSRVPFTLYQGGVFLFQGKSYLVETLEVKKRYSLVKEIKTNYITRARDFTDVDPFRTVEAAAIDCTTVGTSTNKPQNASVSLGEVNETVCVFGFYKLGKGSSGGYSKIVESVEIMESQQHIYRFRAPGVWINIPSDIMRLLQAKKLSLSGSIHAVEHAMISLVPICISMLSDPNNILTECKSPEKEFKKGISNVNDKRDLYFTRLVQGLLRMARRFRL